MHPLTSISAVIRRPVVQGSKDAVRLVLDGVTCRFICWIWGISCEQWFGLLKVFFSGVDFQATSRNLTGHTVQVPGPRPSKLFSYSYPSLHNLVAVCPQMSVSAAVRLLANERYTVAVRTSPVDAFMECFTGCVVYFALHFPPLSISLFFFLKTGMCGKLWIQPTRLLGMVTQQH